MLGADQPQVAQGARSGEFHRGAVIGLEMAAIADHQALARALARGDHPRAFVRRKRHRLLAHHVLARGKGALGPLRVEAGGQDDVDRLDLAVARDVGEVLVGIARLCRDPVSLAYAGEFVGVARNQRGDVAALRLGKARHDLLEGIVAEPDDRVADAARTRRGRG